MRPWLAVNLIDSPTGRALRAIHDSEVAARVLGIDVARYKLIAFVLSAIYAAIAGTYLALFDGFVTPISRASCARSNSWLWRCWAGSARFSGSIVGAAILIVLPQVLTVFHDYEQMVLGLIMIVFMIFLPPASCRRLARLFRRGPS